MSTIEIVQIFIINCLTWIKSWHLFMNFSRLIDIPIDANHILVYPLFLFRLDEW